MAEEKVQGGMYCCVAQVSGLRMLTFRDGSQSGVMGLDEILAAVYAEGRQEGVETTEEIARLVAVHNYIPPAAGQEYKDALEDAYAKYVKVRTGKAKAGAEASEAALRAPSQPSAAGRRGGMLSVFVRALRALPGGRGRA